MASKDEHHGHGQGHGHGAKGGDGHPHQAHGPHRFESADEWAPVFEDPARAQWQKPEAVIDRVAPERDAAIAVIGAGTGYFAARFDVYGREGEPCRRDDGGSIRRIVQGGRSTWFCPVCQK